MSPVRIDHALFWQKEEKLTEIGVRHCIPLLSSTAECTAFGLSVAFILFSQLLDLPFF